ncbi:MAG TPA: hypothetical protein VLI06_05645 [Solimonas sp.]|nr:hypothetical protein [Solimonas sp.]
MASTRIELSVRTGEDQKRLEQALADGSLVLNASRRRPFYFDGRFLTAADLLADQDYVRSRQSDLAQAIGAGVVRGLMVGLGAASASDNPELVIEPGLGITPAGDLLALQETLRVRLDAVPDSAGVDAQLGLKLLASAARNNRSGLFVLALRPVEFSSNPVASYPTTLDGARRVHDGDIVEAAALTLIPYPDRSLASSPEARRARAAREIFFDGARPGALQDALPLAMVCLEGGALRWLDVFLVRREVGAEDTLAAGLGQRPRALLEAWVRQQQDHVQDLGGNTIAAGFAATRHFEVLPSAGLLPASTLRFDTVLGARTLLQGFFPATVDCQFAFVAEDELATLVNESLGMPPIDLALGDEDLDTLPVLIAAPLPRGELERHRRDLQKLERPVRAAAPGMLARRLPFEALLAVSGSTRADDSEAGNAEAWEAALKRAQTSAQRNGGCFWYLRRRQLPYVTQLAGATLRLAGSARELDAELDRRLTSDGVKPVFDRISARLPRLAVAETVNLLATPRLAVSKLQEGRVKRFATSDLLRVSAFRALSRSADEATEDQPLEHAAVLEVARRYGDPRLGEGFDALHEAADDSTRARLTSAAAAKTIADSGLAPELDVAARQLPADRRPQFAASVGKLAAEGSVAGLRKLLQTRT